MKTYKSKLSKFSLKVEKTDFPNQKITHSKDSEEFIRQFYSDDIEIYESFFILFLNRANNTTGYAKISQGGCVGTVVDIKIIAKYAVESLSQSVILCHNHPSGTIEPSKEDIAMTNKIKQALSLFDCNVLDHIILTSTGYYSFSDNGLMY